MDKKELFETNLSEALDSVDYSLDNIDIEWISDMVYDKEDWTYGTFRDFAHDVASEDGNYFYVLRENGYLPSLQDNEDLVRDWLYDHEDCDVVEDLRRYCSTEDIDEMDMEEVEDWMKDEGHEQAYRDVLSYIADNE